MCNCVFITLQYEIYLYATDFGRSVTRFEYKRETFFALLSHSEEEQKRRLNEMDIKINQYAEDGYQIHTYHPQISNKRFCNDLSHII